MSQTVDTPLNLSPDSINTRDKLLKLAQVSSNKSKKKKVSSIPSKSFGHDLSFTENIEHLVNRRSSTPVTPRFTPELSNSSTPSDENSNLSCHDSSCQCQLHANQVQNVSELSPYDLRFSDLKLCDSETFHLKPELKSKIPQMINRQQLRRGNSTNHKWTENNVNMQYSKSKLYFDKHDSSDYFSINNDNHHNSHLIFDNKSHIPVYNSKANLLNSEMDQRWPLICNNNSTTNEHYNSKSESVFLRANSFTSNLSNKYNRKYSHLDSHSFNYNVPVTNSDIDKKSEEMPQKLSSMSKNQINILNYYKQTLLNNNNNNNNNATIAQSKQRIIKSRSHNALHHRDGLRRTMSPKESRNDFNDNDAAHFNRHNNYLVYSGQNCINQNRTFFVMDEECLSNSPKKILNKEIGFQNRAIKTDDIKNSLFFSTPEQNKFLIESQKNLLAKIQTQTNNDNYAKSNSCDNLDDVKFYTLHKPKSETNLSETKNDLTGIIHLVEETARESSGMFNKFRKSFSQRFSKATLPKEIDQHDIHEDGLIDLESKVITILPTSATNPDESDVNQNSCIVKYSENDYSISKMSTIERRKYRADAFNRRSMKKNQRKTIRLKRSHSQPNDKLTEESNDNNDSSDSDNETKQGKNPYNELEDSHESEEVIYAEAIWDYFSNDNEELSFHAGDLIEVTDTSHKEWWWGAIKSKDETRYGWFPESYVRLKVSQEETLEETLANADENIESTPKKRMSMSKMSSEQVRANVVQEIINTERDFVKNLRDVVEGYLKPCRDRSDMFDETRIGTIFCNIEELLDFQTNFLNELEQCIDNENLSQTEIGNCFLNNEKGFSVYCEFCKNHPLAISELQDLYTDHKYVGFFEGCRLLQNMIDISLDGFLLTPIQKICKYPLQLGELLKYTRSDHNDYSPLLNAHFCMQRVAQMVNERKRRFESLAQLISLQESFENWEGPPLIESCSLLIHSGELTRITSTSWSKDVYLFLFDHLLILCKKDTGILKKGTYIFKTRIELDNIDLVTNEDNVKDADFNIVVKNSFKIFYKPKQKLYLFQAKSSKDKEQWINSFKEERERVKEDKEQGFFVSEQDKKGAQMTHLNNLKPKKPRVRPSYAKEKKPDTVIAEIPLGPVNGFEIDRNRAGSLPSYIFQDKQSLNLYKHRQSTLHKKTRSNWFQLGSNKNKKSRLKRNFK